MYVYVHIYLYLCHYCLPEDSFSYVLNMIMDIKELTF